MTHDFRLGVPGPTALRGVRTCLTFEATFTQAMGVVLRDSGVIVESRTLAAPKPSNGTEAEPGGLSRCVRHDPNPRKTPVLDQPSLFHVKSQVAASLPGFRSWKYGWRGQPDAVSGSIV
jgi:hypothetical protein